MSTSLKIFKPSLFERLPIVGILRNVEKTDAEKIVPLYIDAGFTTIEVPINCKGAEELIAYLVDEYSDQLNIGAGSVKDVKELAVALEAGAQFIVMPIINEQVIALCVEKEVPVFPGAFTPTEIDLAWRLGATMVKVFPADILGASFIRSLIAPLQNVKLLPTGGIKSSNAKDYFNAGAAGLGVSTGLFDDLLIRAKDWEALRQHFESFITEVALLSGDNRDT